MDFLDRALGKRMRQEQPDTAEYDNAAKDLAGATAIREDHEALRVWLKLLACTSMIESQLRNKLRLGFDSTLPRFDLMAQLDRNPEGLKMRDLSRKLMVTGGNVTGLTDKLVEKGLVERQDDPRDRRVYSVHLTDEGKKAFSNMATAHERWVIDLFDGLTQTEKTQLLRLLSKLKKHISNFEEEL